MSGLVIDLFAGGGGASVGIEAALGRPIDLAVNHSAIALAAHKLNHPRTKHAREDVFKLKPSEALERVGGGPVDVLWASPDCTHFSAAKGSVPRDGKIRSLAWTVVGDPQNLEAYPGWCRAVRPRVVFLENVREFQTWGPLNRHGQPIKSKAGTEFERFLEAFRDLGYVVEHRMIDAAHYGAPTRRRRLFIIARRDGEPIRWPLPTHGPGTDLEERPASSCIDWSLPTPSIFLSPEEGKAAGVRRPLAEKTLARVAEGVRRYVLEDPDPFIVKVNHGGEGFRGHGLGEPLRTITASRRSDALAVPFFAVTGNGERPGQRPRVNGPREPMRTVTATGSQGAIVAAWIAKHYGGVVGHEPTRPFGTITARDHHSIVASHLVKLRGDPSTHRAGVDLRQPVPTVAAQGNHLAEVRAFLMAYYGSGSVGQSLFAPMRTLTAKARMGLVTVAGVDYQLVDIGMRMLEPHELLAAQFGRFADGYRLDAMKRRYRGRSWSLVPLTKADKIKLIGNSVCPEVAEALVRANVVGEEAHCAA